MGRWHLQRADASIWHPNTSALQTMSSSKRGCKCKNRAKTDLIITHFHTSHGQAAAIHRDAVAVRFWAVPPAVSAGIKYGKWVQKYEGVIDDSALEPKKGNNYLEKAVKELLQNKTVSNPITESVGCRIFYRGVYDKMRWFKLLYNQINSPIISVNNWGIYFNFFYKLIKPYFTFFV